MKYVLTVIGMIILGFIAVMLFARTTTNRDKTVQIGSKDAKLTDYITDQSEVEYTKKGNVVADEEYRTMVITVSQYERTIEIRRGYENTVDKRQTYTNNYEAYNVFMHALDEAGFTRKKPSAINDPTGFCPSGLSFRYRLTNNGQDASNLWNSSCLPLGGTLGNNGALIRDLFAKQIPDYSKVVQNVQF